MLSENRWISASLRAVRDLTPDVREFLLEPEEPVGGWRTGSHIRVEVQAHGRPDIRHYSLIGEPRDGLVRIAVRRADRGRGGSLYMWSLAPGARLRVTHPVSRFELAAQPVPVLLLAGGIGITPLIGMAQALARRGSEFSLLYAGRARSQMAYADELAGELGNRLRLHTDDAGHPLDLAAEIAALPADGHLYVCGPIGLLDAARRAWAEAGRSAGNLHFETFGSSGRFAPEPFSVHVPGLASDIAVPRDGTILDALNAAGIEVLSGCQRGECGLCAVTVLEVDGVIDHRDVYFSDAQHEESRKLCACVSRVSGRSVTLDVGYRPGT
jgi:vanillate O-demethylase ferredoxin subunit